MPLKNSKDGNTKINEPSPSSIKFTNTANVKEIPSRNKLPTNNSVPNNLQGKEFKSETSTPTKSAMKPNTRTNREKAAGINPNGSVLNTSINNALLKGAREGKVPNRKDLNNLFLEENANGEKLLEEMTNPPPKPTFNMKPAPTGPSMVGGRRTKKHRKQRKH